MQVLTRVKMGEDVEQLEPRALLVGMSKGAATMGSRVVVPHRIKSRSIV